MAVGEDGGGADAVKAVEVEAAGAEPAAGVQVVEERALGEIDDAVEEQRDLGVGGVLARGQAIGAQISEDSANRPVPARPWGGRPRGGRCRQCTDTRRPARQLAPFHYVSTLWILLWITRGVARSQRCAVSAMPLP